ncbi:PREDICTED: melanoregulin [Gekko japonicus]|uniref:Melanoregulin n=1 Tax=Gekko japonicus TaxID=146911 RepID=A0ABM1KNQ4_GEKJA|nr:PREDICTED: melanoregulin [Gekko japonicus]
MEFWYKVCCCCCHREEELEKNPLVVGDTLQYFNKLQKRRRSEAINLWSEPADSTHMERDDDHELYMLLQKRSKMRRGSEGYRRVSVDISAHRQIRRKVKDRWKQVLEALGFKAEADGLLAITSSTSYESLRNPQDARRLLNALAERTTIFDRHRGGPPERYLFILDRLLLLDVGEDFLSAARTASSSSIAGFSQVLLHIKIHFDFATSEKFNGSSELAEDALVPEVTRDCGATGEDQAGNTGI